MTFDFTSFDSYLVLFLVIVFPWFFIYKIWSKNKKAKESFGKNEPEYEIDHEVLDKAQAKADKMDLRLELMKNHQCIEKFYSLHGVDENYMYTLIGKFRDEGIHSDFIFVQSMPTGYASYMGNTGTYEFFVETDKLEEAKSLMQKILSS